MDKEEALKLIDQHKNKLIDPVEMLYWTWLRVTIVSVDDAAWKMAAEQATVICSR